MGKKYQRSLFREELYASTVAVVPGIVIAALALVFGLASGNVMTIFVMGCGLIVFLLMALIAAGKTDKCRTHNTLALTQGYQYPASVVRVNNHNGAETLTLAYQNGMGRIIEYTTPYLSYIPTEDQLKDMTCCIYEKDGYMFASNFSNIPERSSEWKETVQAALKVGVSKKH